MNKPTAYQIEQAMSAWMSARDHLLENDPDLDNAQINELLATEGIYDILSQLTSAIISIMDAIGSKKEEFPHATLTVICDGWLNIRSR